MPLALRPAQPGGRIAREQKERFCFGQWAVEAGAEAEICEVAEDGGVKLLLARARGVQQVAAIGASAGDRVGFFLHTTDLETKRARMEHEGVRFEEATRHEPYGKVAVFRDLYGNRWDLLEPTA